MARAFDGSAERYERGRPGFPGPVINHLIGTLRIRPESTVVELGAGTGKLTRELVRAGLRVVAIEPLPGMRRVFRTAVPQSAVLRAGTAERIPMPSRSADAMVAAQSFHWFRTEDALTEIARVLRPGGGLGLIWNLRDERVPWVAKISELLNQLDPGVRRSKHRAWRPILERRADFTKLRLRKFRFAQRLGRREMIDRFLSVSFVAGAPGAKRRDFRQRLERIIDSEAEARGDSDLELAYVTEVYTCRLRARNPTRSGRRRFRYRAAARSERR